MLTLEPLYDKILVKVDDPKGQSKAGIILPDVAKNERKPRIGTVIAVGGGRLVAGDGSGKLVKLRVDKGDRILFGAYAGTEIEMNDEKFIVIAEEEVMGFVREDVAGSVAKAA